MSPNSTRIKATILKVKHPYSLLTISIVALCLLYTSFFFYPKWEKGGSEATIGWDVSGYYLYLPAIFIYKDLRKLEFQNDILKTYQPTPELQQSFKHDSGNYVMKYSCGQAVQMLPFFAVGHAYALSSSKWKADGYSRPYQFMISFGALFTALIGLIFIRRYLLFFFNDRIVGLSLLLVCLGSNYLEYAGITGAMTHNGLFTLYALLLYASHRFYNSPGIKWALVIGGIIGLMGLTRPTELIAVLIPITYGLGLFKSNGLQKRHAFLKSNYKYITIAIITCGLIGSLQLIYWKYVTGEWIVYSYQEQGFSWFRPHLWDGLFSYRSGWLTYSPIMIFSILGFFFLRKVDNVRFGFAIFFASLFIYIAFAWDIWWYGGSLGQRTMVQAYPILCIPFTFFISTLFTSKRWLQALVFIIAALFLHFNIWLTYQAHKGKMLHAGQMTKAYFWKTAGTWKYDIEDLKLLDNDEVYYNDASNSSVKLTPFRIATDNSRCYNENVLQLNADCQFSNELFYNNIPANNNWLRASALFNIDAQEWNYWLMTQMIIRYYNAEGEIIKINLIRPARLLSPSAERNVHIDSKIPDEEFDYVGLLFWHASGNKNIQIRNVKMETF